VSHGVFINGQRPKSKKAIKEAIANGGIVVFENTSAFGGQDLTVDGLTGLLYEADGTKLAVSSPIAFVGPDPYRDRRFYGTVEVKGGKVVVK
jgi:hypothetical protein